MTRDEIPAERVASETNRSLKEVTEILLRKRDVTAEITERLDQSFNWPAKVLNDWQRRYDLEKDLVEQEKYWAWARLMLWCDTWLVAEVKSNIKMIKRARAFVEKRIPARLRRRTY